MPSVRRVIGHSGWLLVGAVAAVGVLHTIVPDHWVPITLIARQRRWSRGDVVRAATIAGTGHTVSTLLIGLLVWVAGAAFATKFGNAVSLLSSLALVAFGAWISISSLRELRGGHGHRHGHHGHDRGPERGTGVHGPELVRIETDSGPISVSIFEDGVPPRFRLSGHPEATVAVETIRADGSRQHFALAAREGYAKSYDPIPEPHEFAVVVSIDDGPSIRTYETAFSEHSHDGAGHARLAGDRSLRTTLLLVLGSSPMVEGIPAFFAAGKFGPGLIAIMAAVFAVATIATYVLLCVSSVSGLRRVRLGPLERYGEVVSGGFIALVGCVFLVFPIA